MTGAVIIGSKNITLCGNAATAIRYKQVFHRDLLMSFKGMTAEDFDADIIKELAFIMAQQATGADFKQVTYDDFIEWLSQFEESEVLACAADVVGIWMQNTSTMTKAKKK